ncbi:MAG TPA: ABC transporter ATP-binding protein [Acidimicrobiales bacterium]
MNDIVTDVPHSPAPPTDTAAGPVLDRPADEGGAPPAVELRGVTKRFRLESGRTVEALRGLDLTIPEGQFACLLGPSGHGKSTLLNLLAGFATPTEGQVVAHGGEVDGPSPDRGMVFQRDALFLWKRVEDNVGFGLKARKVPAAQRREIVDRYLRLTGLEAFARAWPKQLSGGMRRRVAIAMVMANEPRLLLMDEPFVGLDYWRRAALHEVLLRLHETSGCTVVFVTHEIDEALLLGDRLLVMVNGRLAMDEPIPLPRPRTADELVSPVAQDLKRQVLSHLGDVADLGDDAGRDRALAAGAEGTVEVDGVGA